MSANRSELLQQLIEATGTPPPPETEPDAVLVSAYEMMQRRTPLIEALEALGPAEQRSEIAQQWASLREREEQWAKSILSAREETSRRMDALRRVPHQRTPVRKSIGARRTA